MFTKYTRPSVLSGGYSKILSVSAVPCLQCLNNQHFDRTPRGSQNYVGSHGRNFSKSVRFDTERWSKYNRILKTNKTVFNQTSNSLVNSIREQNLQCHGNTKLLNGREVGVVQQRDLSVSPKAILDASPTTMQPYLRLIRFDKPIGTWLLYFPCTWSIALATEPGHLPDFWLLTLFGAGSFFMRGAGCIINDMWDKDFDKKVERTKLRPLASGELTFFQGLCCLGGMLSMSLLILLQLNWYSVFLGAASMLLVVTYPLAKRVTFWPQAMLGLTFNYGNMLGWSAVTGGVDWTIVLPLYISCLAWTLHYDTIYAHQDKYDDMLIGVKSTALKFGDKTKHWLTGFSTIMISGLTVTGISCDQTWPYFVGLGVTASHLAYQLYTVDLNNADDCAAKFRSNAGLGLVMFICITMGTLFKGKKKGTSISQEETAI